MLAVIAVPYTRARFGSNPVRERTNSLKEVGVGDVLGSWWRMKEKGLCFFKSFLDLAFTPNV